MQKLYRVAVVLFLLFAAIYCKTQIDRKDLTAKRPSPPITEASASYESDSLRRYSLGFDNVFADLIWVRLLQNAQHDPMVGPGPSWEYSQLNALTTLDPHFLRAYPYGAAFLSVFRRDKNGAKRILEKWVLHFPQAWRSHYMLAYHAFAELQDFDLSSREMLKAASLPGAPGWLNALSVRLWSQRGAYLPALHIALGLYPSVTDDDGKERLRRRIRSLRYAIQKADWEIALRLYRNRNRREPGTLADLEPLLENSRGLAEVENTAAADEDLTALLQERFHFRYDPATRGIESLEKIPARELETGILGTRS